MDTYRRSGIVTGVLFAAAAAVAASVLSMSLAPIPDAPDCRTRVSANEPKVLAAALLVFIMGWAGAGVLVLFRQIASLSTVRLVLKLPVAPQETVPAIRLIARGFDSSAIAAPQRRAERTNA